MHRRHVLLLTCLTLTACAAGPGTLSMAPDSTLIVTRHADRDGPELNAKGLQRARDLVTALDGIGIDAIFSPGIQRNLDTAAPLAQARGLTVLRRPGENPVPALVRDGAGKTVVWIGNKGNIATIWDDLRLSDPAPLDYGDLHILRTDAAGTLTIERRRYGPV